MLICRISHVLKLFGFFCYFVSFVCIARISHKMAYFSKTASSFSVHPTICMFLYNYTSWKFDSLGNFFHLKMMTGGNFVPSAKLDKTTLKLVFSWLVVFMNTVFVQFYQPFITLKIKCTWVLSIFPSSDSSEFFFFC